VAGELHSDQVLLQN